MPDDRYLEGDPRQESVCFLDLSDFVAVTVQECQLIADLIAAGRSDDARALAVTRGRKGQELLRTLEKPALPEVDVERTPDVALRSRWQFKNRPGGASSPEEG